MRGRSWKRGKGEIGRERRRRGKSRRSGRPGERRIEGKRKNAVVAKNIFHGETALIFALNSWMTE